jgi:hypothetical protein
MILYTTAAAALLRDATQIERDAEQSLRAWILIGQTDRYGDALRRARVLRSAAATRSIWERREILRNAGFEIRSPRSL